MIFHTGIFSDMLGDDRSGTWAAAVIPSDLLAA
jgi:hypothetical protein